MRVPLSWLKDFTPITTGPRDHNGVAELGAAFDSLGLVVEEIEYLENDLPEIVVARVLSISAIEGADRIRKIEIDAGPVLGQLEIVCGAHNFLVGDFVPLAPIGAVLPGGMVITERDARR